MKKLTLSILFIVFCFAACQKDEFDINNPDVSLFVQQLKNGTYDCYEKGENGENLWLIMPEFTQKDIQSLISYSHDTAHISNFPVNPLSSRSPFPERREYFILGECLLWAVEGIKNGSGFGSLDPYLIDTTKSENERYKGLKGSEIILVSDIYQKWWNHYKNAGWETENPLKETSYKWR